MNATNFTTSGEESDMDLVPLLDEAESGEEPVYVGFIESSLVKMVPKFFKALITLLISALLLGTTFLLITLWKRGCRTHRKLEEEGKHHHKHHKSADGSRHHHQQLHSVIVTPPDDESSSLEEETVVRPSSIQPIKSKYMKVPAKQGMLRRASGPFGSDALDFVGEQYAMKNIDKERHHYAPGHIPAAKGPHQPNHFQLPHFHSGASGTSGGSGSRRGLDGGESGGGEEGKSKKFGCFRKGSN